MDKNTASLYSARNLEVYSRNLKALHASTVLGSRDWLMNRICNETEQTYHTI